MSDKLGVGTDRRELKLGASFTNPRSTAFHTVRYDFKPASVDVNKSATIDVGTNNQVTVNVPHLDGAGTSQTVFKGSQKPYQKECVLIIDPISGQITLEKLTSNIQVKKTRSETNHKPVHFEKERQQLDPCVKSNIKVSNRNRKDRPNVAKHSPRQPVETPPPPPPHPHPYSPGRSKPSKPFVSKNIQPQTQFSHNQSTLASLPVIGMDDFSPPLPVSTNSATKSFNKFSSVPEPKQQPITASGVGALSDTSSSSSSSSDDSESDNDSKELLNSFSTLSATQPDNKVSDSSDSDSDDQDNQPTKSQMSVPDHLLNEDLCLSESGSDSD